MTKHLHRFSDGIIMGYARDMIKYTHYTTQSKYITNQEVIDYRFKIIRFSEKYGIAAAMEAFDVSRATIFNWKKLIKTDDPQKQGIANLAPKSTRPHHFRKSALDIWYYEQIADLRHQHPRLGKAKLKPLLDALCLKTNHPIISESTIGRSISRLKKLGRIPEDKRVSFYAKTGRVLAYKSPRPKLKKKRRKGYQPQEAGDLVQIDCVIKFINGIKRYIISGIDYKTSFAYSYAYTHLSSATSVDFLHKFEQVAPFTIKHIQTDNGSEFMARFHEDLDKQGLVHFFNYPRHPKSNGKIERYNRTVQEECIDCYLEELAYDIDKFNQILTDWLIYYNTKRPHFAHRHPNNHNLQISPIQAMIFMLKLDQPESKMLWTHTCACIFE